MGKDEPYKKLRWLVKVMVVLLVLSIAGAITIRRCMRPASSPAEPPPVPIPVPKDRSLSLPKWIRALLPTQKEDEGSSHFTVYRWKDDHGNWHYTDRPPTDGTGEMVVMDRNEGITTLPVHDIELVEPPAPDPVQPSNSDSVEPFIPMNPMKIKARAEEAKALLEGHFKQQQEVLDQGTSP